VRDLCLREMDYVQANRMLYLTYLRDAYLRLNLKTNMFTERVAIPVDRSLNYVLTPSNYLELSSIAAPDHHGKLQPMIINPRINVNVSDLALAKRCGCDCGCSHDLCASVRNFELITGTANAKLPDGSTKAFTTTYRKIILKDGSYVEEKTVPVLNWQDNTHISTTLQKQTRLICTLELDVCGCVKPTDENKQHIEQDCGALSVAFECGCTVLEKPKASFNTDEQGDRIYLPSNFDYDYVVMRYWANTKTKDIRIPFMAKEPLMSGIKVLTSTYIPKEQNRAEFWKQIYKENMDTFMEDMSVIKLADFYEGVLGRFNSV
jgi:hypothetical protein